MEIIITPIVEIILKPIAESVARPIGVLLHYKRNLRNLEDEAKNLENQRSNVQGRVNEAKDRGEDIQNNATVWLKDADEASQGVDKFRAEKSRKENMLCFNFQCPNLISRYRLSKEAQKKVDDFKSITDIGGKIDKVSYPREAPLEVLFPSSGDYESFDSRKRVFKDIVKALKNPEVNMIGVYGTGGVGKTAMVTKVGEQLKKDGIFDAVAIAIVSKDAIVENIQGQLADRLNLTLSGETEVGRATKLWHRLDNEKENLVILDDVWDKLDLKEIGIPIKDGSKSCKVLLTSRNRDVLKNMTVGEDFEIKFLSENESWILFNKKVENYGDADEILARAVSKECQGLPVAIIALGAALKDKDINAWKDALNKLQNSMLKDIEGIDPKVYTSLKWSYDRLDSEDAKSCFLLCCLFPEDSWITIDGLMRYFIGGRSFYRDQKPESSEIATYRIRTVIGTLQRRCLLLDNIYNRNRVKMHDVVRDVAISIAKVDKSFLVKHGVIDWPNKASYENCSVISLMSKGMRRIPDGLRCPELDTLRLDYRANEFQLEVPDRFFNGMENLTVLHFLKVKMSPVLPTSIAKLAKLQMLCLDGCELGDITGLKNLKDHLEILSLQDSSIKVLPPEVGELSLLRQLDMDRCKNLEVIPKGIISKLCCLEHLYMPSTFGNWEGAIPGSGRDISVVSLDELMSLTRLTTLHVFIPDAALLPEDFSFENLVTFRIVVGEIDNSYHDYTTGALVLANIHLAITLGGLLGKPKRCMQRTGLYPSKSFNQLTRLSINDCRVKYLFSASSVRGLVQLKELTIERCMDMEGVIGNEGEEDEDKVIRFSQLNKLRLKDLPNFISFYLQREKTRTSSESSSAHAQTTIFTDKVSFPALEVLSISSLPNISNIWDKKLGPAESFSLMWKLDVELCNKLVNVVESTLLPQLRNLKELYLRHSPMVEAIVNLEKIREEETQETASNTIVSFPDLSKMALVDLQNIRGFCALRIEEQPIFNAQVAFPKLRDLNLDGLGEIALRQLLRACKLNSNTKLWVNACDEISTVVSPHLFRTLPNMYRLIVSRCTQVTEVFHFDGLEGGEGQECVGPLAQIRTIRLRTLPQLTRLWNKDPHDFLSLQNLNYLTITDCPLLRNLMTASVAKALSGLKSLYLKSCSTMEEVIATEEGDERLIDDDEIVFPKLEWLILKDLSNLKSFCIGSHNFHLPSLKKVVLKMCHNMQSFTSGALHMPPTFFISRGKEGIVIEDLNKHLQQLHLKGEEIIELGSNEMRDEGDKFDNLHLLD